VSQSVCAVDSSIEQSPCSILLKWDLRSARDAKQAFEESFEDPTVAFTSSRRPRGITSIALGTNDSTIYGLGTDGNVHSYLTKTLQACPSLPRPSSTMALLQFACKLSTSPCGRWLATGSTDGRAYLYDVSSHHRALEQTPVALHGHKEHVTGLNWANGEVVRSFPFTLARTRIFGGHHGLTTLPSVYSLPPILTILAYGYGGRMRIRLHDVGRTRMLGRNGDGQDRTMYEPSRY